jgi:hypothetical protein
VLDVEVEVVEPAIPVAVLEPVVGPPEEVAPLVVIDPRLEFSLGVDAGINVPASEAADVPATVVLGESSGVVVAVLKAISLRGWLEGLVTTAAVAAAVDVVSVQVWLEEPAAVDTAVVTAAAVFAVVEVVPLHV